MAKNNNSQVPKWVWVFTFVMVSLFIGMLWLLSTVEPASPPTNTWEETKKDVKTAIKDKKETTPEPPKTGYDFYKLLEEQKVVVPKVEEYKSTPREQIDYIYRSQAASFRSKEDAENLRASLILEGMQSYITSTEVNGKAWHRVFVGPFDNRSVMNKVHDKLVTRGISPMELKEPVKKAN